MEGKRMDDRFAGSVIILFLVLPLLVLLSPACISAGMACWSVWTNFYEQGVVIAVRQDADEVEEVS